MRSHMESLVSNELYIAEAMSGCICALIGGDDSLL